MRIAAVIFVVTMALGMIGCADPCGELNDLCDGCTEAADVTACQLAYETTQLPLVGTGDDGCQQILDDGTFSQCE